MPSESQPDVRRSIRVLIVDDHPGMRQSLALCLRAFDDLELVGEATSGETAVCLCERLRPDAVLMDLVMPGMDGVSATQIIRQRYVNTQVIVLTSFREEELLQLALEAGARLCLFKDVSPDVLADTIRAVCTSHGANLKTRPDPSCH